MAGYWGDDRAVVGMPGTIQRWRQQFSASSQQVEAATQLAIERLAQTQEGEALRALHHFEIHRYPSIEIEVTDRWSYQRR